MVSFHDLDDPIRKMGLKKRRMKAAIPFQRVKKYLADLVQAEERLNYKAGQILFYEGHQPYGIYVLRKGRIRLFSKQNGEEDLLKIVEPPQVLGESEFLESKPFGYSAKAETDVSISFFSRASIKQKKGRCKESRNE